ncbi:Uncharacterized protein Adt_15496 [Abeliophyllum distichum]|uniref:Uncharacterized protein n=1 Tax=Abeliophyllum distichum TaxID=126358 RepID=A0ABD1U2M5_9LAMI
MFRRILRAYDLAPTQVAPNGWSQMVGSMYLWFRHSFGMEMPLQRLPSVYQPRKCRGRRARRRKLVGPLPRCELSRENTDVLRSIYEADIKGRSYNFILNRQRCLVELGLVASKAEMDQGETPPSYTLANWLSRGRDTGAWLCRGFPRREGHRRPQPGGKQGGN